MRAKRSRTLSGGAGSGFRGYSSSFRLLETAIADVRSEMVSRMNGTATFLLSPVDGEPVPVLVPVPVVETVVVVAAAVVVAAVSDVTTGVVTASVLVVSLSVESLVSVTTVVVLVSLSLSSMVGLVVVVVAYRDLRCGWSLLW